MIDRRTIAVLGVGLTGLVLVFGLLQTPGAGSTAPTASRGVARTFVPGAGAGSGPDGPLVSPVTVTDGRFDDRSPRTVAGATRHKNQSKLFFAYDSWWGILQEPETREARIMRLDWATQRWHDTGVVVDQRPFARADALFHDDTLYVATAGSSDSPSQAVWLSLFTYDKASGRWSIKPDYPVTLTTTGVTSSVIERADDGTLWVTFIQAGRLLVTHSGRDPHEWVKPFRPVVSGTDVSADQVGIVAVKGEVLLLWSNQKDDAVYATSHTDGRPDDEWAESTPVLRSLEIADDHVNIKALPDGRIFAAVKTSLDLIPSFQAGWDQILLLTRTDGRWTSTQVGQIRDKHTRPIVVLDTGQSEALVFATTPYTGGSIVMKAAPFDNLQFPVGKGTEVITLGQGTRLNNATSTKQPVDASTGLVVLASDDSTGRYAHVAASLGGPAPGVPTGDPPDGPEPAPPGPVVMFDETNNTQQVGAPVQPLWELTGGRDDGKATYVARARGDAAIRLQTTGAGALRVCRDVGTTLTGDIRIGLDVRLDRQGPTNTFPLMVRGGGTEVASVRIDEKLRVRIAFGTGRDSTNIRIARGRWYRVEMDLDAANQTLGVRLVDSAGRTILSRSGLSWRSANAEVVEKMCVESSSGARGLGLSFDDVRVARSS